MRGVAPHRDGLHSKTWCLGSSKLFTASVWKPPLVHTPYENYAICHEIGLKKVNRLLRIPQRSPSGGFLTEHSYFSASPNDTSAADDYDTALQTSVDANCLLLLRLLICPFSPFLLFYRTDNTGMTRQVIFISAISSF